MSKVHRLLLAAIAAPLAGCAVVEEVLADAQLALDGNQAAIASAESTYLGGVVFSSVDTEDPDEAVHGELPDDLRPRGCASWRADDVEERLAAVVFEACDGPFELKKLRGSLVTRFSLAEDGSLHAEVESHDLGATGRPIDFVAAVDLAIGDSTRTLRWHADWMSEAIGGGPLRQASDLTLTLDEATDCRVLSGTADSDVDGRRVATDLEELTICADAKGRDQCPEGTMIHRTHDGRRRVTVVFDGTRRVRVERERGAPVVVELDCRAR